MVPLFWYSLFAFIIFLVIGLILIAIDISKDGDSKNLAIAAWIFLAISGIAFILMIIGIYASVGRGVYKLGKKAINAASSSTETKTVTETTTVTKAD